MFKITEPKIYIINTITLFEQLIKYSNNSNSPFITVDTETNSAIEKKAKLYGIGICFDKYKAFYIPWRSPSGEFIFSPEEQVRLVNWFKEQTNKRYFIGHNIIYDTLVLENNLGIDITGKIHHDTILSAHLLNEEADLGLKDLARVEFGEETVKSQDKLKENVLSKGGKWLKEQKDMYLADTEILGEYCAWDCILCYNLFLLFEERLKQEELYSFYYKDETMDLLREVVIPMKRHGYPVNVPYFEQLDKEITEDLTRLEHELMEEIAPEVFGFIQDLLNKDYPISNKGNFPKALAEVCNIIMPITKEGKVTLAEKAILLQKGANPKDSVFYDWVINGDTCPIELNKIKLAQEKLFFNKHPNQKYIFNLGSNDHLKYYFFEVKKFKPLSFTKETHSPQVDEDFLDSIKTQDNTVNKLIEFKKLNKIHSTYIRGILDRHIDGILYTNMLIFGTTSGRFSSKAPNCQNLPRTKEDDEVLTPLILKYTNAIRKGFIAGDGNKIVNCDYGQLEICCFAHMSGDKKLQQTISKGEDIYSRVAIDMYDETAYSADKKSPNYLKKLYPELRTKIKPAVLGIVYGMGESRLIDTLGGTYQEARQFISKYLKTYPNLKKYMAQCDLEAKTKGQVKTIFGRIRHLSEAKQLYTMYKDNLLDSKWAKSQGLEKERRRYKNLLNLAKNHGIQGLAAHLTNRAMIAISKQFKRDCIPGYIALTVHDEITVIVEEVYAEQVKRLMKHHMENTIKLSVPLTAEPIIADNWMDAK